MRYTYFVVELCPTRNVWSFDTEQEAESQAIQIAKTYSKITYVAKVLTTCVPRIDVTVTK